MFGKWSGSYHGKWWGRRLLDTILRPARTAVAFVLAQTHTVHKMKLTVDKFIRLGKK